MKEPQEPNNDESECSNGSVIPSQQPLIKKNAKRALAKQSTQSRRKSFRLSTARSMPSMIPRSKKAKTKTAKSSSATGIAYIDEVAAKVRKDYEEDMAKLRESHERDMAKMKQKFEKSLNDLKSQGKLASLHINEFFGILENKEALEDTINEPDAE